MPQYNEDGDARSIALRLVDYFNDRRMEELNELIAPEVADKKVEELYEIVALDTTGERDPGSVENFGLPARGEGVQQLITMLRASFNDLRFTVNEVVAEGDRVALKAVMTGTHAGAFLGVPPTGNPIRVEGVHILHIVEGKLVEHSGVWDRLALMQQIQAAPDMRHLRQ